MARELFKRHVALPGDHGSWVFLACPLLIGLFAGGRLTVVSFYLVIAALSAFLVRQPITIAIKVFSGRRGRSDLPAAVFWTALYSAIGLLHVTGLVLRGFGYLLYLAIPGVPVFAWYLYLVSRKSERRQLVVELAATAVLSLTAPAGYWVGLGRPDPLGWWLFALVWAQTSASIVVTYLRLWQREQSAVPTFARNMQKALPALAITSLNLMIVSGLCAFSKLPAWLFLAYLPQWAEAIRGSLAPGIGVRPTTIGFWQLGISLAYTLLFILAWRF